MSIKDKIKQAEDQVTRAPSDAQKEAGNYKKGKVIINGFKITIENPVYSIRSGKDKGGNIWSIQMKNSYGYFNGTVGKDGDQIDVFIGGYLEEDFNIYIVDQVDEETRSFDEHKVMFGFPDIDSAKEAYLNNYNSNWKGFGNITEISVANFKKFIKNEKQIKHPASKLSKSNTINYKSMEKEKIKSIQLFGEVLDGETLKDLKNQLGETSDLEQVVLEIASPGGSVSEGLEIMVWLDSLSQKGIEVTTVVVANAYSIASLIMLAADVKLISKHGEVMVHNPMVPELEYVNADDLEKHAKSLRNLQSMMYELYEIFTGIDEDKMKGLMDNETYISPKNAVELGFADMVIDINKKSYEMTINAKKAINMNKAKSVLNRLNRVISMVNKSEFVNQLYYDKEGGEIEIFQKDPSTYSKGDRTSLEEGEISLSDGSKLIIEDFLIKGIDKSISPEEETEIQNEYGSETIEENVEEIIETPQEQVSPVEAPVKEEEAKVDEELKEKSKDSMPAKVIEKTESTVTTKETVAAQVTRVSKWEYDVLQDSFELGTKVEYAPNEFEPEPYGVGAGEWLLDDGRMVLTDSDSIIRYIKPTGEEPAPIVENFNEGAAPKSDEEVINKEDSDKDKEMVSKEDYQDLLNKYDALESRLTTVENTSKDSMLEINKFQEAATEAIDSIALNTSSNFVPEARVSSTKQNTGSSIFKGLLTKRGLQ